MKKKHPWHLWLIVLLVAFMYGMGIYDMPMMLSHNGDYYASHGYGQAVAEYFTNYPVYLLALWLVNLLSGFLSPLILIFNARTAKYVALTSSIADAALLLFTFAFRNRLTVLGTSIAVFDIFILFMTIGFYLYCRMIEKRQNNL
ncbi:hypothetical protein LJC63_10575 [Ruminococcaceae bacterium OttesenSCG-928-L11]|nr:hypothetical protein [Ruminococcaceae bacterium OttesenSCG-928-L11]